MDSILLTPRRSRAPITRRAPTDLTLNVLYIDSSDSRMTKTDRFITHLLTDCSANIAVVSSTKPVFSYTKAHLLMLQRNNILFPKSQPQVPRTPRTPKKDETIVVDFTKKYTNQIDYSKYLNAQIKIFQQYFVAYSQRELTTLYTSIYSIPPRIDNGDMVLFSQNDSEMKKRLMKLDANFLMLAKVNKQIDCIIYLSSPVVVQKQPLTLSINSTYTIQFSEQETFESWSKLLKKVQPWYVTLLRRFIRAEVSQFATTPRRKTGPNVPKLFKQPSLQIIPQCSSPKLKGSSPLVSPRTQKILSLRFSKKERNKNTKIVGVSLEQIATHHLALPENVLTLINYIKNRCLNVEGIFRVNGSKEKIETIADMLDNKVLDNEMLSQFDVFSVVGALKYYIKVMPTPVIPADINDKLLQVWNAKQTMTSERLLKEFVAIFVLMPEMSLLFLNEVLGLLKTVSDNKEQTKMTVENCVTCIQPSLRGYPFIYSFAIQNYDAIFGPNV
ncbi:hypothetical protein EIN_224510 [Entamoeba invadens IP1]|uniref:Rho-GAP domain-containing protein n=1 Tax=Entamoeba invadens IP1 TaxID=370355 RepID=A0A0A1U8A3_ENTIV|nr:hypothetical protein EIN_224510 [Entamoeba invadens IP1]ELP88208.1 hypothetical protein EIN_224510 [Entamoeba invadens IP1]|eukprot:XP_004254979.1 hypothetical protein EIN_224510 [Entamoeba invadens IP1]